MPDKTPATYFDVFNEIGIIEQLSRTLLEAREEDEEEIVEDPLELLTVAPIFTGRAPAGASVLVAAAVPPPLARAVAKEVMKALVKCKQLKTVK